MLLLEALQGPGRPALPRGAVRTAFRKEGEGGSSMLLGPLPAFLTTCTTKGSHLGGSDTTVSRGGLWVMLHCLLPSPCFSFHRVCSLLGQGGQQHVR